MMNWLDEAIDATQEETVAWQNREGGSWSKTHKTIDGGRTTLCGQQVPEVNWMTDSTSSQGRCKACIKAARKEAK